MESSQGGFSSTTPWHNNNNNTMGTSMGSMGSTLPLPLQPCNNGTTTNNSMPMGSLNPHLGSLVFGGSTSSTALPNSTGSNAPLNGNPFMNGLNGMGIGGLNGNFGLNGNIGLPNGNFGFGGGLPNGPIGNLGLLGGMNGGLNGGNGLPLNGGLFNGVNPNAGHGQLPGQSLFPNSMPGLFPPLHPNMGGQLPSGSSLHDLLGQLGLNQPQPSTLGGGNEPLQPPVGPIPSNHTGENQPNPAGGNIPGEGKPGKIQCSEQPNQQGEQSTQQQPVPNNGPQKRPAHLKKLSICVVYREDILSSSSSNRSDSPDRSTAIANSSGAIGKAMDEKPTLERQTAATEKESDTVAEASRNCTATEKESATESAVAPCSSAEAEPVVPKKKRARFCLLPLSKRSLEKDEEEEGPVSSIAKSMPLSKNGESRTQEKYPEDEKENLKVKYSDKDASNEDTTTFEQSLSQSQSEVAEKAPAIEPSISQSSSLSLSQSSVSSSSSSETSGKEDTDLQSEIQNLSPASLLTTLREGGLRVVRIVGGDGLGGDVLKIAKRKAKKTKKENKSSVYDFFNPPKPKALVEEVSDNMNDKENDKDFSFSALATPTAAQMEIIVVNTVEHGGDIEIYSSGGDSSGSGERQQSSAEVGVGVADQKKNSIMMTEKNSLITEPNVEQTDSIKVDYDVGSNVGSGIGSSGGGGAVSSDAQPQPLPGLPPPIPPPRSLWNVNANAFLPDNLSHTSNSSLDASCGSSGVGGSSGVNGSVVGSGVGSEVSNMASGGSDMPISGTNAMDPCTMGGATLGGAMQMCSGSTGEGNMSGGNVVTDHTGHGSLPHLLGPHVGSNTGSNNDLINGPTNNLINGITSAMAPPHSTLGGNFGIAGNGIGGQFPPHTSSFPTHVVEFRLSEGPVEYQPVVQNSYLGMTSTTFVVKYFEYV